MFKPGDKVRCTDATLLKSRITLNKVYEVLTLGYHTNGETIRIRNDSGDYVSYYSSRFEKVADIKIGDKVIYNGWKNGHDHSMTPGKVYEVIDIGNHYLHISLRKDNGANVWVSIDWVSPWKEDVVPFVEAAYWLVNEQLFTLEEKARDYFLSLKNENKSAILQKVLTIHEFKAEKENYVIRCVANGVYSDYDTFPSFALAEKRLEFYISNVSTKWTDGYKWQIVEKEKILKEVSNNV